MTQNILLRIFLLLYTNYASSSQLGVHIKFFQGGKICNASQHLREYIYLYLLQASSVSSILIQNTMLCRVYGFFSSSSFYRPKESKNRAEIIFRRK